MDNTKVFLTYDNQIDKLNNEKKIACNGELHKNILVKSGYFNLINGYKKPFTNGKNENDQHVYLPDTTVDSIYNLKVFDDTLRMLILNYVTQIEVEIRALFAYKFDEINDNDTIHWFNIEAYNNVSVTNNFKVIANIHQQLLNSKSDYIKFYFDKNRYISTWIVAKVINFSTFIDFIEVSKDEVITDICDLYDMNIGENTFEKRKRLLIGSLNWLRKVRNKCAHNERIFDVKQTNSRIYENYISQLSRGYQRDSNKTLFDLFVYFKYYLNEDEYNTFITEITSLLNTLRDKINSEAFKRVRANLGIKRLEDLNTLASLSKKEIIYSKFPKQSTT